MSIIVRYICSALIGLSVVALCVAVVVDFKKYAHKTDEKKGQKSIVATGTMFMFFGLYYIVLALRLFALQINDICVIFGTIMVVTGSAINIISRLHLGSNWANHIKIYGDHSLITTGMYSVCRHPLYASLILALFGGALAYSNWLCAVLTAIVFIPMMNYRANQEERLLIQEFPEYKEYMKKVRRFI